MISHLTLYEQRRAVSAAVTLLATDETWTTGKPACDARGLHVSSLSPRAVRWCATGAVTRCVADAWPEIAAQAMLWYNRVFAESYRIVWFLDKTAHELHPRYCLSSVNDHLGREAALHVMEVWIGG